MSAESLVLPLFAIGGLLLLVGFIVLLASLTEREPEAKKRVRGIGCLLSIGGVILMFVAFATCANGLKGI